jgi:hypothetical protein
MEPLGAIELEEAFDARWPEFESRWKEIREGSELAELEIPRKPERDVLEEIHSWVRAIATGNLKVSVRTSEILPFGSSGLAIGAGKGDARNEALISYLEYAKFIRENPDRAQAEAWFVKLMEVVEDDPELPFSRDLEAISRCEKTIQFQDGLTILTIAIPSKMIVHRTLFAYTEELSQKLTVIANNDGVPGKAKLIFAVP